MEFYEKREAPFEAAEIDLSTKKTEIQNYYTDKTILVTGGTGFLGMLIIEKLLRCCPDIRKLILIVRPKRGKSLHRRMQQLFSGSVYEKMKLSNPDYWKKIEVLNGDCELPYLGQDSDEWSRLQTEVNIILHAAATIRFDEHIKISYNTNVGGTKYLLNLAENAVQLDAFVYVSTAYSQSHLLNIEEEFYPTPFSDQQIMQLIETLDDQTLACMTPIILDGQFNTYTMTKAVAENVVKLYADKLPVAVIRPSIVTSTLEEPLTSWTNSISGATGVFVGAGIGLLRTLYCDENMKAEIIPADRVINALLRIPLHLQKKAAISKTLSSNDGVNLRNNEFTPIYNYISTGKSIKWADTMVLLRGTADSRRLHAKLQLWRHHLKLEKHYYFWMIQFYLVHLAPLPFFLMVEKMAKQKPRIWSAYIKLYHYTKLLSFFMTRTWNFSTKNTSELLSFTSKEDDMLFNANSEIDWNYYFFSMAVGVGTHIVGVNWNSSDQNPLRRYLILVIDEFVIWTSKALIFWFLMKVLIRIVSSMLAI